MGDVERDTSAASVLLAPDRPAAPPPGAPPQGPGDEPPGGDSPRRRRRRGRLVLGLAAALVVALAAAAGALWTAAPSVGHLGDPFEDIPATARATADPAAGEAMNILVIGSDSRAESDAAEDGGTASLDWRAGGQRSDVMMVAHLSADGRTAQVVSIPRDSWVPVPGYGTTKINAAFSYGGAALAVQTVEQLTGVRIDHVAAIDFDGFARVTDALGGVDICVPQTTTDGIGTVQAGCQRMDGEQALEYVRQRKTLPGGDFDRQRRQQNWMRSVITGVTQQDFAGDPLRATGVVRQLAASVQTDDGLGETQLVQLALSHRSLRADDVTFLQAPLADPATGDENGQSVVHLDDAAGAQLWEAVRTDEVAGWLAANPGAGLAETVR